jgi:predicted Holliday junction resolvase-like endonuclease
MKLQLPPNGKAKTYLSILLYLVLVVYMLVANGMKPNVSEVQHAVDLRVVALEENLKNIKENFDVFREDNKDAHDEIKAKLNEIAKDVKR